MEVFYVREDGKLPTTVETDGTPESMRELIGCEKVGYLAFNIRGNVYMVYSDMERELEKCVKVKPAMRDEDSRVKYEGVDAPNADQIATGINYNGEPRLAGNLIITNFNDEEEPGRPLGLMLNDVNHLFDSVTCTEYNGRQVVGLCGVQYTEEAAEEE